MKTQYAERIYTATRPLSGKEKAQSDPIYEKDPTDPKDMSNAALRGHFCMPWHNCRRCTVICKYGAEYLRRLKAGEMAEIGVSTEGYMPKGSPRKKPPETDIDRFSVCEIAKASGILPAKIENRRKQLGFASDDGLYTYDQVLQMIRQPIDRRRTPSEGAVSRLAAQLKRDGFI